MITEGLPPVTAAEFERSMAAFEPFEAQPAIAVGVSGGRDSVALALLARDWVRARDGELVALTVDHGLRPESRAEALCAQRILAEQGIAAAILSWTGERPRTGLQSQARRHRYRLLRAECRRRGILHLLVAHQADDQAETLAMRAARGSGPDGLSGMASVVELPELRLLRPLLGVARSRLTSTLRERAVRWLDDPSNLDPRFERARLRMARPRTVPATHPAVRHGRDGAVATAAVELLEIDDSACVAIDRDGFAGLSHDLQGRLLGRIVQALGGRDYLPRQERLATACRRLCQPASGGKSGRAQDFTLSGCRLMLRRLPRQAAQHRRLRWIVSPENGTNAGKPLFPAAFSPVLLAASPQRPI